MCSPNRFSMLQRNIFKSHVKYDVGPRLVAKVQQLLLLMLRSVVFECFPQLNNRVPVRTVNEGMIRDESLLHMVYFVWMKQVISSVLEALKNNNQPYVNHGVEVSRCSSYSSWSSISGWFTHLASGLL